MKAIVTTLMLLFMPAAFGLTEGYVAQPLDYIFYTFALSMVAFATLVVLGHAEYRWLAYTVFSFLLILVAAGMDGVLASLIGETDFVLWVVPFLINAGVASYGYLVIAWQLEPPHYLSKFKPLFIVLAVISALFALSSYFWLEKISLVLMWLPVNILFFGMILGQMLPPFTWSITSRPLQLLIYSLPIVVGVVAIGGFWVLSMQPDSTQQDANIFNRFTLLLYACFSLAIVIGQVFTNTKTKEKAERDILEAAKKEAEMQLALVQADQAYEQALSVASRHRSQLASVTHDLKQPISALRVAIDNIPGEEGAPRKDKLAKAVDYIDSLSRSYVDTSAEEQAETPSDAGPDKVSTTVFADALGQMFSEECQRKGIELSISSKSYWVFVEPLSTMRIMTNLIANAIEHADAKKLLVVFRPRAHKVIFQVHDNGCGISEETLRNVTLPGVKGDVSSGEGLGLSIVRELCEAQSLKFSLRSNVGRGSSASVQMPRAQVPKEL